MTTIRVKKDSKYFAASNEPFNDKNLSWEARGLMGYLLSKPDDWRIRVYDLMAQGPAGRQKIQHMLAELESAGYLRRECIRLGGGRFDWVNTIYETPNPELAAENHQADTVGKSKKRDSTVDGKTVHGAAADGEVPHISSTESPSTESLVTEDTRTTAEAGESATLRANEQETSSQLVEKTKQAFAVFPVLSDMPGKDDPRYAKWQKGYKGLAERCTRRAICPTELARRAAVEVERMHTLITWPGSLWGIADAVSATPALKRNSYAFVVETDLERRLRERGELDNYDAIRIAK